MKNINLTVGYVGMSHLGINSAAATAAKGANVICFDQDNININNLKRLNVNIDEPNLLNTIKNFNKRMNFTTEINELNECDLIFISKDIKTDDTGNSDLSEVNDLIDLIITNVSKNITVIILCQVPPGFTRNLNRNKSFLYYQVETLIFGKAIERALNPERIIVGCADDKHNINEDYKKFLNLFDCPILPMVYESAELAKTAINIVLAAQVSTANSLSEICELSNGDWNEIIPALNLDKRIGHHAYLYPGLGISGGNIERDLSTVSKILKKLGGNNNFLNSIVELSSYRKEWLIETLNKKINEDINKISILGLSYKINTNSIKNSPSIELINKLCSYKIKAYDPIIKSLNKFSDLEMVTSLKNAILDAQVIFVMLPCNEFNELNSIEFKKLLKNKYIIDPYRVVNDGQVDKKKHFVLGKS